MEALDARYAALVTGLASRAGPVEELAAAADQLADEATSVWLAIQARALGARARLARDADPASVTVVADVTPPAIDDASEAALLELLPGSGPPIRRLKAHRATTSLAADRLATCGQRLLELLCTRSREDLSLPAEESVELELVAGSPHRTPRVTTVVDGRRTRLLLNASASWAADDLVRSIAGEAYPGRHLARIGRPPAPGWSPSPEGTVLHGLAETGREALLGDHELAFEIERIGRAIGARWDGHLVLAMLRTRAALAPFVAHAALAPPGEARALLDRLGFGTASIDRLLDRWKDPGGRVDAIARAGGPPLVREWLVVQGQTAGLQRLVTERLVPAQLRADLDDAR